MDVLLAILLVIAFFLLFADRREGFAGDCGNAGIPAPGDDQLRLYTQTECGALGGRFLNQGMPGWLPGYSMCATPTSTDIGDISRECAYLNPQSAPAAAPMPMPPPAAAPMPMHMHMPAPAAAPMPMPPPAAAPMPMPMPAAAPPPVVVSTTAPLPQAMPTPTGGNTITSLPIPGIPSMAPQAAGVMTSTPVGAPLGSGMSHGILLTMV